MFPRFPVVLRSDAPIHYVRDHRHVLCETLRLVRRIMVNLSILLLIGVAAASLVVLVHDPAQASGLFQSPLPGADVFQSPIAEPTPALTASQPFAQVYVLTDELYAEGAPAATEESSPVPVSFAADDNLRARITQLNMAPVSPQASEAPSEWSVYYFTDFESNFVTDGGPCIWDNHDPGQPRWWERDTQRKWSGNYAIWPAAHPAPAPSQYPNGLISNLICRLDNMAAIDNIMVEFKIWLQLYDPGDKFQVMFSSDGNSFRGIEWRGSNNIVNIDWTTFRFYYPDLAQSNTGDRVYHVGVSK